MISGTLLLPRSRFPEGGRLLIHLENLMDGSPCFYSWFTPDGRYHSCFELNEHNTHTCDGGSCKETIEINSDSVEVERLRESRRQARNDQKKRRWK